MNEQPEALRLAEWLDGSSNGPLDARHKAAAELRRQHYRITTLEADLRLATEALEWISRRCPEQFLKHEPHRVHWEAACDAGACARFALAKATGGAK